jgi:hypothetical protein
MKAKPVMSLSPQAKLRLFRALPVAAGAAGLALYATHRKRENPILRKELIKSFAREYPPWALKYKFADVPDFTPSEKAFIRRISKKKWEPIYEGWRKHPETKPPHIFMIPPAPKKRANRK